MKAFDIIDELTRDSYCENTGTFTADSATNMDKYLGQIFGEEYEIIYDPKNLLYLDLSKERQFVYVNNDRFDRRYDKDIFAILWVNKSFSNFITTIYEIE